MFITFEGPDGSGKTTQSKLLYAELQRQGRDTLWTREPGGTAAGQKIRALLLDDPTARYAPAAELFLFAADRAQHVEEVIRPALTQGKTVICDRYVDSTTAYQAGGRGFDADFIAKLNKDSSGGLLPELTFLLDILSEIGLQRATSTKADKFEQESLDFHRRVRQTYLQAAQNDPRFCVLDGNRPKEVIFAEILAVVCAKLNK
ncbi:MAG: dTMP kinase [Candidatus Margulisbacteria bacterium]|jgi:dTMP kinase|nr:dTMP kinase [Candidatus Margulisiibacteriota bacterium]